MHEGLVACPAGVGLGLGGRESGLGMKLLRVLLQFSPPRAIPCPMGKLVSRQAGGVAEPLPTLAAAVPAGSPSAPSSPVLLLLRSGGAPLASPTHPAAAVLLAESVEVGLVAGAELEADLEVGRSLAQVLLTGGVVVQQLLDVGHLVLGQLRGCPEAHVALRASVELIAAWTLDDGGRHVLLPLCPLVLAAGLQRVAQGGYAGAEGYILGDSFSFFVDEAVA